MMSEKVAEVYWIHLDSHTDIRTEGYVGITTKTTAERFKGHLWRFASGGKDFVIYKAFEKYGVENIKVTTICITDREHARWLELQLRPKAFIGWNMAQGGMRFGETSEETRKQAAAKRKLKFIPKTGADHPMWKGGVSEYYQKKHGLFQYVPREVHSANISKALTGLKQSDEAKESMRIATLKRFERDGWWSNGIALDEIWMKAAIIYVYRVRLALPKPLIQELTGLTHYQVKIVVSKFKQNWIPLEDQRWINYYESNKNESDKSIEELKVLCSYA